MLDGAPVTLVGSSLGGTLAILAADRFASQVDRVVLLAPAVMFAKPGHHLLPPERIDEWRRRGSLPFFHYGYNAERPLNVAFYEDSLRYDPFTRDRRSRRSSFRGCATRPSITAPSKRSRRRGRTSRSRCSTTIIS